MKKSEVLNKGYVHLVDHMGSDLSVVNAARVSFDKEAEWAYDEEGLKKVTGHNWQADRLRREFKKLSDKDQKLVEYLAKHNHWTPFAHPQITLRIKAPISIRTQFFKHKQGFVENEISRRYVSFDPEFYIPQWRGEPKNGAKQGSDDFITLSSEATEAYKNSVETCLETYINLLDVGVAPEQARFVLPQAMYTEWYWTGSLMAFARVCTLRLAADAQKETQVIAKQLAALCKEKFPISWKYLVKRKT